MKHYSTDAYYRYAKKLLEGDNNNTQLTDKANDPQFKRMIVGASAGGVGAVACLKYLDNTFSMSNLNDTIRRFNEYSMSVSSAASGTVQAPTIWRRILGALKGLVAKALGWVQTFCGRMLKGFPELRKPIIEGSTATYGSVLCMALVGAAVGAVLYRVYKFIRGRRKKTESVAAYNLRKERELNLILTETTAFFDKIDRLSEGDGRYDWRNDPAVRRRNAIRRQAAWDDANIGNTTNVAPRGNGYVPTSNLRNTAPTNVVRAQPVVRPSVPVNPDYNVGGALWQTGVTNPTDTLRMSGTYDPNTMDATTRMAQNAKANASAAYNKTTDLTARRAQIAKDNAAYQTRLQTAKRAGIDPGEAGRLAHYDSIQNVRDRTAMAQRHITNPDPNAARAAYGGKVASVTNKTPQVFSTSTRQLKNGGTLKIQYDKYGNAIKSEVIPKAVPASAPAAGATNAATTASATPAKSEGFIANMQTRVMEMWTSTKTWCSNNPMLATMIGICAALIACWYGVKKYKEHQAKKAGAAQTAESTRVYRLQPKYRLS